MHRYCFMQCVFYMVSNTIYLHFSRLSIMNSKLAIHESESPRPAASSIMISQMPSSSVIIPYVMEREGNWRVVCKFHKIPSTFLFLVY